MLKEIVEQIKNDRLGLSLSKLKTYENCPYKYYLMYIKKIKIDKKDYNPKFFKIGQYAHKYIDSKLKNIPCVFNSTTLTDEDKNNINKKCEIILKTPFIEKLLKMNYETEIPFSMNFLTNGIEVNQKYSRKADFAGYINFYSEDNDTLYVIDWKTGNVAKNTDETFFQVYLYAKALIVLKNKKYKNIKVGYVYIDHNKYLLRDVTEDEIDNVIENLISRGMKIPKSNKEDDFKPNKNTCKWCPYGKNGNNYCKYDN